VADPEMVAFVVQLCGAPLLSGLERGERETKRANWMNGEREGYKPMKGGKKGE